MVGSILFSELGQRRTSLLSPSQLAAADFCSGSCLLVQADTLLLLLFFFFFVQLYALIYCLGEVKNEIGMLGSKAGWRTRDV